MNHRSESENRLHGVVLILASACFFALSGIFTKSIDQSTWTILGWRGLVGGLLVLAYVLIWQKRAGLVWSLRLGREGWIIATTSAVAGAFFIASFKWTTVSNVVVIYATVPFMAAAIAWFWMRERLTRDTLIAAVCCLVGVVVTVLGSLGSGNPIGDLMAVCMTALCAVYLVMIRVFVNAPSVWASGVAALLLMIPAALFGDYSAITTHDAVLMTCFGASFAGAIITWTEGARLIPSAEAGMLGTAEIPVAVALAAILLSEFPTLGGLIGGGIVLATIAIHAGAARRRHLPA